MKNYLPVIFAAALIVSTGVVHGFWTGSFDIILGKPSASEQQQVFAKRMNDVPSVFGSWIGTDLPGMDAREKEVANIDMSLEREYKDPKANTKSSVFLVSGHFRDIAVHTPDQCYVAAGYEMMADPMRYMVETPVGTVEAYTTVFKKEDTHVGAHYLRVFWTWSVDGKWVAPDSPRIEFVGQPALYKMYIISQLQQPSRPISEDPSLTFIPQFIPELNKALFPESLPDVGSDPQDALEPAATSPTATTETPPTATPPAAAPPALTDPIAIPPAATEPSATPPAASPPVESAPAAVPAASDDKPGG